MAERWIWIVRWPEFQHYTPERDRAPAWIKDYPRQLDDARYLRLTDRQRALLGDLRRVFATMRGRLPDDAAMIARRRGRQTRDVDLEALSHAGLIEFCSRQVLDQRLEKLYASRARPRAREEVEGEEERSTPLPPQAGEPLSRATDDNGTVPATLGAELEQAIEQAADAKPCLVCGEPVRPGYRCPSCNSNPRTAGSDSRTTAKRRTTSSALELAATYTRNEGWQYPLDAYHDDLNRFDLTADERRQLEQLRAEILDEDADAW